jgi:hypothetical protein
LQKETEDLKSKLAKEKAKPASASKTAAEPLKKRPPMLGKSASGEVKFTYYDGPSLFQLGDL